MQIPRTWTLAIVTILLLTACGSAAPRPPLAGAPPPAAVAVVQAAPAALAELKADLQRLDNLPPGERSAVAGEVESLVSALGTPVVDGDTLYFFYEGIARQVEVAGSFVPALEMKQMAGTDLWVTSKSVPDLDHGTVGYFLTVDDKVTKDPFTKLPAESTAPTEVTLHGPAAPHPPELQAKPNVPHGRMESFDLTSPALGESRRLTVYLPPGYDSKQRYPVLYAADAQIYLGRMKAPDILDNLLADGRIQPIVGVFIDSNYSLRLQEYVPTGDRWELYQRFLLQEVIPLIETRYSVSRDRSGRVMLGLSNGAALAAFTAIYNANTFDGAIIQSAAYLQPYQLPARDNNNPQRYYFILGTLEEGFADLDHLLLKELNDAGHQVKASERTGGHEPVFWSEELVSALAWMFPGKSVT